jgi:hypothetical protein
MFQLYRLVQAGAWTGVIMEDLEIRAAARRIAARLSIQGAGAPATIDR